VQILRQLRRLPGTGFSDDDDDAIVPDDPEKLFPDGENRQELTLLLQRLRPRKL
jgi:hypothetical protein